MNREDEERPGQVRVILNLGEEVLDAVQEMAQYREVTRTEIFREAISTEKFLFDVMRRGAKIIIIELDGTHKEILFKED